MAKADPEQWTPVPSNSRTRADRARHAFGVAGTVRQEDAVWLTCDDIGRAGRRRKHLDRCESFKVPQDRSFDSEVERNDAKVPVPAVYGFGVVTSATRSIPPVPGSALAAATKCGFVGRSERARHRARSRRWRVSRRVSMPAIPAMP